MACSGSLRHGGSSCGVCSGAGKTMFSRECRVHPLSSHVSEILLFLKNLTSQGHHNGGVTVALQCLPSCLQSEGQRLWKEKS
jgi:hypothetical protein